MKVEIKFKSTNNLFKKQLKIKKIIYKSFEVIRRKKKSKAETRNKKANVYQLI
jgi:hypothetical protein